MYIANIKDDYLTDPESDEVYKNFKQYALEEGSMICPISAQIESELAGLSDEEEKEFLEDLGLNEPGLNRLIKETYKLLGYQTFFTTGPDECKAWTFKRGMKAPECAGIIHTDFEKGFIKAETISYNDLIKEGTYLKAREAGLVRQEGKDYIVQDGDIMLFKFNVTK